MRLILFIGYSRPLLVLL